jgi:hypothetical protein
MVSTIFSLAIFIALHAAGAGTLTMVRGLDERSLT